MQRACGLQPDEIRQSRELDQLVNALYQQYGQIQRQREQIQERLPQVEDQQRALVRNVVARLGINVFHAARIVEPNILVDVPDEPAPSTADGMDKEQKPDGLERRALK